MLRRTFTQIMGAAAAFIVSPFKAKKTEAVPTPEPAVEVKSHKSCCYVYNPGPDIDGIGSHLFGQSHSIKGGVITRINSAEERLLHPPVSYEVDEETKKKIRSLRIDPPPEAFISEYGRKMQGQGLFRIDRSSNIARPDNWESWPKELKERIPDIWRNTPDRLMETWYIITHPAKEMVDNLWYAVHHNYCPVVHIKDWDDKDVDIKAINQLLAAPTIAGRINNVRALPMSSLRMTATLRQYLFKPLDDAIRIGKEHIERYIQDFSKGRRLGLDPYMIKWCQLLGEDPKSIKDRALTRDTNFNQRRRIPARMYTKHDLRMVLSDDAIKVLDLMESVDGNVSVEEVLTEIIKTLPKEV
jgi:hypothetical protein